MQWGRAGYGGRAQERGRQRRPAQCPGRVCASAVSAPVACVSRLRSICRCAMPRGGIRLVVIGGNRAIGGRMSMEWVRAHRRALMAGAALMAAVALLGRALGALVELCAGGAALAFVMLPLTRLLSRRMKRGAAIIAAFACVAAALVGVVLMLVPVLVSQAQLLMRQLPGISAGLSALMERARELLYELGAGGASLAEQMSGQMEQLPGRIANALGALLSGTAYMAGSIADGVGRLSLMVILAYYFLKDRERLLMQLELMLPLSVRARVIEAGGAIQRELSAYVRGQLIISLLVGALTAGGLAALRVPAFLVLGLIMAVFNLVPYFGALLGAIPIMLLTVSMGWVKILEVAAMLFAVQQLENMVIAPRVTGRTTGMHPVAVILALTAGGYLGGIMGMVFALPGAIVLRGVLREAGRAREPAE